VAIQGNSSTCLIAETSPVLVREAVAENLRLIAV